MTCFFPIVRRSLEPHKWRTEQFDFAHTMKRWRRRRRKEEEEEEDDDDYDNENDEEGKKREILTGEKSRTDYTAKIELRNIWCI